MQSISNDADKYCRDKPSANGYPFFGFMADSQLLNDSGRLSSPKKSSATSTCSLAPHALNKYNNIGNIYDYESSSEDDNVDQEVPDGQYDEQDQDDDIVVDTDDYGMYSYNPCMNLHLMNNDVVCVDNHNHNHNHAGFPRHAHNISQHQQQHSSHHLQNSNHQYQSTTSSISSNSSVRSGLHQKQMKMNPRKEYSLKALGGMTSLTPSLQTNSLRGSHEMGLIDLAKDKNNRQRSNITKRRYSKKNLPS